MSGVAVAQSRAEALAPMIAPMAQRRAYIIVIGNEKGGAGKSTLAMHLVAALAKAGRRVGALDLDQRQRTLTRYLETRAAIGADMRNIEILAVPASALKDRDCAEADEGARFELAMRQCAPVFDFIVIDSPGSDSYLSRLAHSAADTLVTPLNDSFLDFDVLAETDPETLAVKRPSFYSEMVWDCRKRRAAEDGRPIDWIVLRNRLSPGRIEARNSQRLNKSLRDLAQRVGFRLAPGLTERVIFRELFPKGLTLIDLAESELTVAQVAARQELRDLFITLKLPSFAGEALSF